MIESVIRLPVSLSNTVLVLTLCEDDGFVSRRSELGNQKKKADILRECEGQEPNEVCYNMLLFVLGRVQMPIFIRTRLWSLTVKKQNKTTFVKIMYLESN